MSRNTLLVGLGAGLLAGVLALGAGAALGADSGIGRGRADGPSAAPGKPSAYVGAEVCKECHEQQYQSYKASSKKVNSFDSVRRMSHALSEAEMKKCYECHTTGYDKLGGFVSEKQTPQMAEASCEVCHGPGGQHAQFQFKQDIKGKLEPKDCTSCQNAERVGAFNFRPLIYSGGHQDHGARHEHTRGQVQRRVWIKMLTAVSLVIAVAVTVLIALGIRSQSSQMHDLMREQGQTLSAAVEGA